MVIKPEVVREMKYHSKSYICVQAFYLKRSKETVFRVDRILKIRGG
ncbi:MAG: hypothetical protein WBE46_04640 [Dehalococcoidia bacterium]